jgi:hypothetical protein
MDEVVPGLLHWTSVHERWGIEISSYLLVAESVAIDPRLPPGGLEQLRRAGPPRVVLLTNRHHYRHSDELVAAFGTRVLCNRAGLHEFTNGEPVEPFDPGDELPGGVRAVEIGVLCPDETALHIPAHRALAVADGVMREPPDGPLAFVPDDYMGDDPAAVKAGLVAAYRRVLDLDFAHLLMAHGRPLVGDAKTALATFLAQQP